MAATDPSNRPVTGRDPPTPAHRRRPRRIAAPALPCRRVSRAIALNRRRPGTALDRTCPLDSAQDPDRVRPNHPPATAPRIRSVRRRANGQGRSRTRVNSHPVRRIARASSPSSNVPAACRLSAPAVLPDAPANHHVLLLTAPTVGLYLHRNAAHRVPPRARASSHNSSAPGPTGSPHGGPARTPRASSPSNDRSRRVVRLPAPFRDRIGPIRPVDADRFRRSRGGLYRHRVEVSPGCLPRIPRGTGARQDSTTVDEPWAVRLLLIGRRSGLRSSPGRRRWRPNLPTKRAPPR